jgi:hypothetical protein
VRRFVPAIIAIIFGWLTLLTYFVPLLAGWRAGLVGLAVIVAAFAAILGSINVLSVHATHIVRQKSGWFFSFVVIVSMLLVLLVSVYDALSANRLTGQSLAQQGVSGVVMTRIYEYVLIPIQATLAALLPFLLGFAAYRMLRVRRVGGATVFLVTAIIVLLGQVPLLNQAWLSGLREWIVGVPVMAGMRGILLGVGIGITATAVRVLIGQDRPSSE